MDTDKELLLRHKIKLTARESSRHMERCQSSLYKNREKRAARFSLLSLGAGVPPAASRAGD